MPLVKIARSECTNGEPDLFSEITKLILHEWQAIGNSKRNKLHFISSGDVLFDGETSSTLGGDAVHQRELVNCDCESQNA